MLLDGHRPNKPHDGVCVQCVEPWPCKEWLRGQLQEVRLREIKLTGRLAGVRNYALDVMRHDGCSHADTVAEMCERE